ncbi:conjugal transfer relaxosome DNA-binding protein TraM [Kosakonia sp. R1.Fl]|uniref:conjugal transfer relaxosome DNA-binding protein TraM n=1 Tax=Kosakonia sp. R1.Fl TaxID=2928706 RepID=UPI00201E017E|nr:conjugal transfer relaxosome DNA-binding protein TraM [Kosakonia sp. R1.Fl]MCL6746903.1 relaxosome protein TraM [Kosakonia sp. R1.Fl]
MPRIQTFVSNQVRKEIESMVAERRQEGATEADATISSVTSMLIELGLRVYRIQRENSEKGFSQVEYNKVILDNISRVRVMCTEIMKMSALSHEVVNNGNFDLDVIKKSVMKFANEQVNVFFPNDDEDE